MYKDNLLSLFIVVNTYALLRLTSSYCITNIGANAGENFPLSLQLVNYLQLFIYSGVG